MKQPKKSDLSSRLLDIAEKQLQQKGYEKLSMREVCVEAGVAASAPYRHIPNRQALLDLLAERGFQELINIYAAALESTLTPKEKLAKIIREYIAFACDNPQMFRLMFDLKPQHTWGVDQESNGFKSFYLFERLVSAVVKKNVRCATLSLWSAIQGAAMLMISNAFDDMLDESVKQADIVEDIVGRYT